MGVLGLWQLLAPVGQPVALESLENKIFAVDISIWLNQAVKGYRDAEGGSVPNAHLLSLFSRLCKLLFYRIRPVIVFDGGFPELKKQTIINRQQRRAALKQSSRDIGLKILTNYLASQNLASSLPGAGDGSTTPKKTIIRHREKIRDELFALPPLPNTNFPSSDPSMEEIDSIDWKFTNFSREDVKYLNQIDLESDDFNKLPADVKQEILSTLKESRKHRSWGTELPEDSDAFSSYQMQGLLKKRTLQKKLEQVQRDVRKINSADFVAQYTNDHVIGETNKIMSDDCSHYVLLKKIIQKSASNDKTDNETNTSMMETKNAFIMNMENIDVCEEEDLEDRKKDSSSSLNLKTEVKSNITLDSDVEEKKKDFLGSLNLKTEIESEVDSDFEGDVDNPPIASLGKDHDSLEEKSSELEIKLPSSNQEMLGESSLEQITCTKIDTISSCTDGDFKITKSSTLENNSISSKVEITDEKASLPLEDSALVLSSSDEEMIPCEEVDVEALYSASSSGNAAKSQDEAVLMSVPLDSHDVKDAINNEDQGACDIKNATKIVSSDETNETSLLEVDRTKQDRQSGIMQEIEPMPSTSFAPPVSPPPLSEKERAEMIRKNLQLQEDLETATSLLEADRAKQDRQAGTVQDHMVEDCKELLRLFGIPFIVSPSEAEAQCAFYDAQSITHGTITDDSDVWLFGGTRVYKNFFAQQKHVEFYKSHEIFTHFGLSRKKLVNFALLTGSDYTVGIDGVGPVTAMEVLSEFPGDSIDALMKFKEWWQLCHRHARPPENKVRAKLLKLVLGEKFPEAEVFDAYLSPVVDDSTERFTWGRPDLDALRDYARERFGWNKSKVDDALLPVIRKLSERDSQTHIDNFFTVSLKKQQELFPSKRIMSALKKMTSPHKSSAAQESDTNAKKRKVDTKKSVPKKKGRKTDSSAKKAATKTKPRALVLSEESSDDA